MAGDDKFLTVTTSDLSGGINDRVNDTLLPDTMAESLDNIDIGEPGRRKKRLGSSILSTISTLPCVHLHNFIVNGETDQMMLYENTNLRNWLGSGQFSSPSKSDFTASQTIIGMVNGKQTGITPDDVCLVSNGTDNVYLWNALATVPIDCGDEFTSPPKTPVYTFYRNRFWALKNDLAYYADAAASSYAASASCVTSGAFNRTTNAFRIPVGTERAIVPTRESGMVFFGQDAVWALNPSTTPAATDKPEPLITNLGCVANNTAKALGDDIYWLAQDGVRSLKRNIQDKQQLGVSYPVSYKLKSEFDSISWAYVYKACAVAFDNKYFISLPVDGSTYNNSVWVYYPATDGWTTISGWNVGTWVTYSVGGQERLYYGDATTGIVYRAWTGTTDSGTAITSTEISKGYNMGYPFQYKFGGNLELRAETGGGTANIYYNIDDAGWVSIGTFNTAGSSGVTFNPYVTFDPTIEFGSIGIISDRYHLDKMGLRWKKIQFKIVDSSVNTLNILDNSVLTHIDEYEEE